MDYGENELLAQPLPYTKDQQLLPEHVRDRPILQDLNVHMPTFKG